MEFLADKIPYVDPVWDAVHPLIRPPAAALLAYGATVAAPAEWRWSAALLAGGVALQRWRHKQVALPRAGGSTCAQHPKRYRRTGFCRREIQWRRARVRFREPMDARAPAANLVNG